MIKASHISFLVNTDTKLVNDISLEVNKGEFLVIVGPNGSGKSTLLKMLTGAIRPTSGYITLDRQKIHTIPSEQLARKRAVLSQSYNMSSDFLVQDLVMMGRYLFFKKKSQDIDLQIMDDYLEQIGITHLKYRNLSSLSGGERQRVHLARVLAQLSDNEYKGALFLDEPTNNLDICYQYKILEIAKQKCLEGYAVVVVLHDLNLASRYADRVVMLDGGKKVADGLPKDILNNDLLTKVYQIPMQVIPNSQYLVVMPV